MKEKKIVWSSEENLGYAEGILRFCKEKIHMAKAQLELKTDMMW